MLHFFAVRFTWDSKKASANLAKHGVSFDEAASVFDDRLSIVVPDVVHEDRAAVIGFSGRQRVLYVVHVEWDENVRIISARKATSHERRDYEEAR